MKFLKVAYGLMLTERATLSHSFIHSSLKTFSCYLTFQPCRGLSKASTRGMKRKATNSGTDLKAKRQKEPEADYCDVVPKQDAHGSVIWPSSEQSIHNARDFLKEW